MNQEIERTSTSVTETAVQMIWDCGSPLYDSFELASLSHIIERHMMVLPQSSSSSSTRLSSSSLSSSCSLSSPTTSWSSSTCNMLRSEGASYEVLKRKVEWEEVSKKKAKKRIKVSGCFCLNGKFWKK